jgi:hypothetical protein
VTGFCLTYALLLGVYIAYIVHTMRVGPERDLPAPGDQRGDQPLPESPGPLPRKIPIGPVTPGEVVPGVAAEEAGV